MVWQTGLPGISQSNPTLQAGVRIESQPVQSQPVQYYMPPQPVQYQPQPMQFQPPQDNSLQYLQPWMPEPRRQVLSQIGFGNGAGLELLSLRKQYDEERNNYAKQALMSQIANAETRFNRELQGQEQEYRDLSRAANYAGAKRMVDEETAAGRGEGLAAMAGNAILSNNHFSHGIINHGRMVAPAGNAVEDALKAYQMTGRTPNQSLLQMLAVSDALTQYDYMPSGPFDINKSIGGYKSMSIAGGSYTGNTDAFAYGGDGSQYARQEAQNILRDHAWQQQANERYIQSINNRMPVGDRKGTGNGITNTGVSGRVIGYSPPGSSGPAQNTGYGPGGGASGRMPDAPWVDTEGDNWKWTKDGWEQTGKGEQFDPVNDQTIRDLRFRGQVDSQANQMRSQGVPEYQVQEFIKRMNKPNGMLQLPPMSAYPAAMGIAEAPPMQSGSMSPNNDVFAEQFTPAPSRGDATHWPYGMRTQSNSFDRYAFNPMLAGAVDARMNRK